MDNGVRVAEFPNNPHIVDSKYTIGVILLVLYSIAKSRLNKIWNKFFLKKGK